MLSSLVSAASVSANVARPVANMHSKPSMDADVVSQAIYGTGVGILEEKPGWARVRTPDEYTGWMEEGALHRLREDGPGYAASGRIAGVESLFANVYQEPDVTKHAPVMTVPFETRLVVQAEPKEDGARWIQVVLVDRRTAWIQRGDISFDNAPLSVAALAGFSKRFLGLPYLWGGTSTFGFDCSGFVQMLYRRIGVMLPRDAQPQAEWQGLASRCGARICGREICFTSGSRRATSRTPECTLARANSSMRRHTNTRLFKSTSSGMLIGPSC